MGGIGFQIKDGTPDTQQEEDERNEDQFEVSRSSSLQSPDVLVGKDVCACVCSGGRVLGG